MMCKYKNRKLKMPFNRPLGWFETIHDCYLGLSIVKGGKRKNRRKLKYADVEKVIKPYFDDEYLSETASSSDDENVSNISK